MSLDQKQLAENAAKIARAAVLMEAQEGVPAEIAAAQCAQESGWGAKAPGNNPFGIKYHQVTIPGLGRPPGKQTFKTTEYYTQEKADREKAKGKRIEPVSGVLANGKKKFIVWDDFAAYDNLDHAFLDYARLIKTGKFFKPIWDRFQVHKDKTLFLRQLSSVYATDPDYCSKLQKLIGGKRLSAAIASARANLTTNT